MRYKIRYKSFWEGFSPENFIITQILRNHIDKNLLIVSDPNELVDLEICSSFLFKNLTSKAIHRLYGAISREAMADYVTKSTFGFELKPNSRANRTIWYSGENLRPPFGEYDLTLSFEITDDRNLYFPYWMTRLDWGLGAPDNEISPTPISLVSKRAPLHRSKNVCVFSTNKEPNRVNLINMVKTVMPVETYGKAYDRFVTSKLETSANYGFQICNENDLYPGYVTEKLQEAWTAGNIPIWSGLFPRDSTFNEEAIIDVTGRTSDEITYLLSNMSPEEMAYVSSLPLLKEIPSLSVVEASILALT